MPRFTINGDGVLSFRESLNYDNPQSAAAGVPQVSRPLGATLSDEDEGVSAQTWQWARPEDGTTWMDIEGATSPRRSPAPDDVGMYLRAKVTYSDKLGSGETASAVSVNRVEARTLANAAPSFTELDDDEDTPYIDVLRSVAENTAVAMFVGKTVSATDAELPSSPIAGSRGLGWARNRPSRKRLYRFRLALSDMKAKSPNVSPLCYLRLAKLCYWEIVYLGK